MWTNTALMFSQIAIPTEHLERRIVGEALCFESIVQIRSASDAECPAVFGSVFPNMIDGEEPDVVFQATGASSSVSVDSLLSNSAAFLLACFSVFGLTNTTSNCLSIHNIAALHTLSIGTSIRHAAALLLGVAAPARFACSVFVGFRKRRATSCALPRVPAALLESSKTSAQFVQTAKTLLGMMLLRKRLFTLYAEVVGFALRNELLVRLKTFFLVHHSNIMANRWEQVKC